MNYHSSLPQNAPQHKKSPITQAAKLDMILKSLKMAGNTTVLSEVQNEEKSILKYEIEF